MRKLFLGTAALAAACLFQVGAYAELTGNITAKIPFTFHVGEKMLPAGEYSISEIGTDQLEVRNDKTGAVAVALGATENALDPAKDTELMFNRYGDNEFLREVKLAGETAQIQFEPSKMEQKLIQESKPVVMHAHPAHHDKMAKKHS